MQNEKEEQQQVYQVEQQQQSIPPQYSPQFGQGPAFDTAPTNNQPPLSSQPYNPQFVPANNTPLATQSSTSQYAAPLPYNPQFTTVNNTAPVNNPPSTSQSSAPLSYNPQHAQPQMSQIQQQYYVLPQQGMQIGAGDVQLQVAPQQFQQMQPQTIQLGNPIIVQQIVPTTTAVGPVRITNAFPTGITCPHCHQNVTTKVDHVMGVATFLTGCVCCPCMLVCPCLFCLPCFLTPMKDAVHKCPSCKAVVGVKKVIG